MCIKLYNEVAGNPFSTCTAPFPRFTVAKKGGTPVSATLSRERYYSGGSAFKIRIASCWLSE